MAFGFLDGGAGNGTLITPAESLPTQLVPDLRVGGEPFERLFELVGESSWASRLAQPRPPPRSASEPQRGQRFSRRARYCLRYSLASTRRPASESTKARSRVRPRSLIGVVAALARCRPGLFRRRTTTESRPRCAPVLAAPRPARASTAIIDR